MKVGIIGTRSRDTPDDYDLVEQELWYVCENDTRDVVIVSGGCPKGGDRFAKNLADRYNLGYIEFPAEWSKYGRSAGFRRNGDIARASDKLIACVSADRTGGTEDTIKKFLQRHSEADLYLV